MWEYDHSSHRVILNVKGDRYARRRKKKTKDISTSLLNRPRIIVLGIILIALLFFFLKEAKFVLAYNPQFKIKYVQIENTKFISQQSVLKLLKPDDINNLFAISAKGISRKLRKDPDIKSVVVEKQFPDTLKIVIKERTPYARIIIDDEAYFVDANGIMLLRKPSYYNSTPLVQGVEEKSIIPGESYSDSNLEIALDILKAENKKGLNRFLEVTRIDMRDPDIINIDTRERISIIMERKNINEQLDKLISILNKVQYQGKIIRKVDLRFKDVYVQNAQRS